MKLFGLFIVVWMFLFAIYGGVQLYTCSDRLDLIESQRAKIINLELKVRELKRINNLIPILEQLLIPRQIDELEAGAERVRQKKCREYERYEQPLITEKENKNARK